MAKSLETLLAQINALSPNRDKSSDGGIGNAEHSARRSDHNPDVDGVVKARDFTNDPAHGIDSERLAEALRQSKDSRIKYLISNRKIAASYPEGGKPAWAWRPYHGVNPHNHHCHVSVVKDAAGYDSTAPWDLTRLKITEEHEMAPLAPSLPVLRLGYASPDVETLQELLNKKGASIAVDGKFGPATKKALKQFQYKAGLVVDGIAGPYTWRELNK